ncbi:prefoldin subunit alpha [Candidatus Woesearchaeota archaeon]|nr:prefoldin subunit alpha [Candidatus Woesearchaeota archaeon]
MEEQKEKLQSLYLEFQILDQQIKQLEKQGTMLSSQLMELVATSQSLEEMKNVKENTEILVPLSSGIYAKAELKDNKKFIVNVGSNTAVAKDIGTTKQLIETQINEIQKLQEGLTKKLQDYTYKAALLEQEISELASSDENNN